MLKADPYANFAELRPNNASVVWDIGKYQWQDQEWMKKRAVSDSKDKPFNIYEVHLVPGSAGSQRKTKMEIISSAQSSAITGNWL